MKKTKRMGKHLSLFFAATFSPLNKAQYWVSISSFWVSMDLGEFFSLWFFLPQLVIIPTIWSVFLCFLSQIMCHAYVQKKFFNLCRPFCNYPMTLQVNLPKSVSLSWVFISSFDLFQIFSLPPPLMLDDGGFLNAFLPMGSLPSTSTHISLGEGSRFMFWYLGACSH